MKTIFWCAGLLLGGLGLALAGLVAGAPRQLRVENAVVVRASAQCGLRPGALLPAVPALPAPLNGLAPLLGLRGNIRQVNERGLANLRRHCEQLAAARPAPVAPALAAAR